MYLIYPRTLTTTCSGRRNSGPVLTILTHASREAQGILQGRISLNIIIRDRAAVVQRLSTVDQIYFIWANSFLVLNFELHVVNGFARFRVNHDCFRESLDEDLHRAYGRVWVGNAKSK